MGKTRVKIVTAEVGGELTPADLERAGRGGADPYRTIQTRELWGNLYGEGDIPLRLPSDRQAAAGLAAGAPLVAEEVVALPIGDVTPPIGQE